MRINLVNYEAALGIDGILSKFAHSMEKSLAALGHTVTVSVMPLPHADVNHHINYNSYCHQPGTINTLQITHITNEDKLCNVTQGMMTADMGICLSEETQKELEKKGITNLTTVYPAHDGLKRRRTVISILTNVYNDGCKREWMFAELLRNIDMDKFTFLIMGKDWEPVLTEAPSGLMVEYHHKFDAKEYKKILDRSDYCLYFGKDEGSMGILDATNAGIRCIAPNIGFHQKLEIAFPFDTQKELEAVFERITRNPVADWTWMNYCKQHEIIWKKLSGIRRINSQDV